MTRRWTKAIAATLLLFGGLGASSTPAGAGGGGGLTFEPDTSDRQIGRFDFQRAFQNGLACLAAEYAVFDDDEGVRDEVDDDLYEIDAEPGDAATGTLTITGLPAGFYVLVIECIDGPTLEGSFVFARLTVEKVVEGDAPDGAAFAIEADCDGGDAFSEELEFGAEGGSAEVFVYVSSVCEVTETDDGGADSSEVEGGTADFEADPIDLTATVTNTFDATPDTTTTTTTPTTTTTTPTTTTSPSAPGPGPAPAPAARAVIATPTFTG